MSDWLERELARGLAPVAAPRRLGIRLGFAPAKRWEFPRLAVAVAAAVVIILGGGYTASRTAALDLHQVAASEVPGLETGSSNTPVVSAAWLRREVGVYAPQPSADGARLARCDRGAGIHRLNAGKATILLAHAGSTVTLAAIPDAGCHQCHSL